MVWVDAKWLKPLLVGKSNEQIQAADEVEDYLQEIREEDPLDAKSRANTQHFLSISPMIRETMEARRAQELMRGGAPMTLSMLDS